MILGLEFTMSRADRRLEDAVDRAVIHSLTETAFVIGIDARASIDKDNTASQPGEPPHTKGGRRGLKSAIRVDSRVRGDAQGRDAIVVGPKFTVFGIGGEQLEHGGTRGKTTIKARPFMGPALEANLDRFAKSFGGSVRE